MGTSARRGKVLPLRPAGDNASMRLVRRLALLCLILCCTSAFAASQTFAIAQVAPGIFVHVGKHLPLEGPGHDDIANIGFIVGSRCVAVVDTGGSVKTGRALRTAIRAQTSLPICYVINTHGHVDHVLGNFAFVEDHPRFVGHAALRASLARSRDLFVKYYSGDFSGASELIAPDTIVVDTLDIDLGDRHLTLRAWPKAHTDCDLTVFDEKTSTLWTGDLLFRERIPSLDGSVKGWLAAIDTLTQIRVKNIVPGHGPVAHDVAAFAPERGYLQSLSDGVRAALAKGEPMQSAMKTVALGERSHWLLWNAEHPHNVARAYEELEWE